MRWGLDQGHLELPHLFPLSPEVFSGHFRPYLMSLPALDVEVGRTTYDLCGGGHSLADQPLCGAWVCYF